MHCTVFYHFYNLKQREKHAWWSVTFSKVACNFTKSNTPPWMFFMFFKLYKWYQITQCTSDNDYEKFVPVIHFRSMITFYCSYKLFFWFWPHEGSEVSMKYSSPVFTEFSGELPKWQSQSFLKKPHSGYLWTKNQVFQALWKICSGNFSDFLDKVIEIQDFKIDLNIFWRKIWFSGFWTKKVPKWGFPSFIKNQCMIFL